jgi:ABC-2 type transport system ATP-binding protein
MALIEATGLRKTYPKGAVALDGVNLSIGEGRIVGLIGPNGAGKSTALQAMLGLLPFEGSLKVLGLDPWADRDRLMSDIGFIADVAVMPRWMRVRQALDYVEGVHPRFDRAKAEAFLARTDVQLGAKVRSLSKGMVTQLHLALVMAVDARLLILDEPTLGLDILYRKRFYDALLEDYFDHSRTILLSTHQVEEIQHILTDVIFINRGRIVLDASMDAVHERFRAVAVLPGDLISARSLGPICERPLFGRHGLIFDGVAAERLAPLGEVTTPSLSDLFVALMEPGSAGRERTA